MRPGDMVRVKRRTTGYAFEQDQYLPTFHNLIGRVGSESKRAVGGDYFQVTFDEPHTYDRETKYQWPFYESDLELVDVDVNEVV